MQGNFIVQEVKQTPKGAVLTGRVMLGKLKPGLETEAEHMRIVIKAIYMGLYMDKELPEAKMGQKISIDVEAEPAKRTENLMSQILEFSDLNTGGSVSSKFVMRPRPISNI